MIYILTKETTKRNNCLLLSKLVPNYIVFIRLQYLKMRNKLQKVLFKLTLDPEVIGHENHFILLCTLIASAGSAIATVFNLVLPLNHLLTYLTLSGVFIYLGLFFIGRFSRKFNVIKYVLIISVFFYLDILWFINYGSKGPIIYVYIVFYSALLFVFQSRKLLVFTIVFFLNTLTMFWLEYSHPELFEDYTSVNARTIDVYSGLMIYIVIATFLMTFIKKMYIRERDNARIADKLKSAFLANMSHEIRTPMNSILGFTQLLQRELPEDKRKKYVNLIHKSGKYLVHIIDDIIDISKIEAGQLKVYSNEINVVKLFEEIYIMAEEFRSSLQKENVKLSYSVQSEKVNITSDHTRLKQIILNLLTNALKFTDSGSVHFTCSVIENEAIFAVEDTGIGIEKNEQATIFDRFRKLDPDNGRIYPGTGIGLSITKSLVELLGGNIWLTSELNEGTKFTFTIPDKR